MCTPVETNALLIANTRETAKSKIANWQPGTQPFGNEEKRQHSRLNQHRTVDIPRRSRPQKHTEAVGAWLLGAVVSLSQFNLSAWFTREAFHGSPGGGVAGL